MLIYRLSLIFSLLPAIACTSDDNSVRRDAQGTADGANVADAQSLDANVLTDADTNAPDGMTADPTMTFFITSEATGCPSACVQCGYEFDDNMVDENNGNDCSSGSGNLGGLVGADAHCQQLAAAAGAGGRTWRAYLSTSTIDARNRIGTGPWRNAAGTVIAQDVAALHTLVDPSPNQSQAGTYGASTNGLNHQTALTEKGEQLAGLVLRPNGGDHDALTGSRLDGTAASSTCNNWTSSSSNDRGQVGHTDLDGREDGSNNGQSWNSAHSARCNAAGLDGTAGAGYFYCFAIN